MIKDKNMFEFQEKIRLGDGVGIDPSVAGGGGVK